jgi:hypothetical protein
MITDTMMIKRKVVKSASYPKMGELTEYSKIALLFMTRMSQTLQILSTMGSCTLVPIGPR